MKEAASNTGNPADWAAELEQLRVLVAKQELNENMIRYCRGMDRKDLDLMKSTYWPEATEDHGMFVGLSHDFCDWVYSMRRESSHKASHYVTNMLIELNGNQAKRETAFIYLAMPADGGPTDLLFGPLPGSVRAAPGGVEGAREDLRLGRGAATRSGSGRRRAVRHPAHVQLR